MEHPAYQASQNNPGPQDASANPTSTPTPVSPQSGRNWKKWFVIFLIVDLLILAGIYYFVLSRQTPQPQKSISKTAPSPTPDPIASWKTYTNDKYGFSMRLPQQIQSSSSASIEYFYQGEYTECCGYSGPNLNINISKDNDSGDSINDKSSSDTVNTFTIAGNEVQKLSGLSGIRIGPLMQNGYVYSFEIFGKDKTETDYEEIYQILHSFKFTDQSAKKRQFDVSSLIFNKQKYPSEIVSTSDTELVSMDCSAYDEYGDNKSTEITKYKSIVQGNYAEKTVTGFQYCKTQDQRIIVSYGLGPCGGGCSGEPHIGIIEDGKLLDLAIIPDKYVYFGCRKPLQLTSDNNLYYECGGGDGPGAYAVIYRIKLVQKSIDKLASCTVAPDPSNVEKSVTSCN